MRLFAAVWPPDEVLDHLDLALASVRGGPSGLSSALRWSARETWHLTSAFYGDLPDGAVPGLVADLASTAAVVDPFALKLHGAGVFAHRTLWVGVGGDVAAQRRLTAACVEAGESAGAWRDERARDRPHLTVARVRPGSGPPRRRGSSAASAPAGRRSPGADDDAAAILVRALSVYDGPTWQVDELLLVESRPGAGRGGGPLYEPVERISLSGPSRAS
ncbi:RNA 2',3'-cyclic phosphodiesterase [Cellulomonas rhizosphaerae]|uniref:RNA 2',3'-cyclic phosphodiesterase n=1 Tax=Cellulomonas rhizosphaerae TaxID=2293719 RepID=A0A413RRA7_9CELL|nr:RNA 2',3'-cyclic phosphodiesterase [Cellulomonas rhizosphaerae]RHA44460.1 RNA 2',3'-cyclic phosphodiesterase [Cellulomonas rhizosphaerae]